MRNRTSGLLKIKRDSLAAGKMYGRTVFTVFCSVLLCFLFISPAASAEDLLNISADNLEHDPDKNAYTASGSVRITYGETTLSADKILFYESTSDAVATGNVVYEDEEVIIKAEVVELNLETRLGTIYSCDIFYKKLNYHINGIDRLDKLGETTYHLDRAEATTCDAEPPEWHFRAEDIDIHLNENIKAKKAVFYIKKVPVLWSPYFYAPLLKDRQTGFLTPSAGYSSTKGFTFKQGFFWAIQDNMDAAFYGDYYSDKGFGEGLDFRYMADSETNGELWVYHLRDSEEGRNFSELKSYHNQKLPYGMNGYLKMHLVNEFDYYSVLKSTSSGRVGLSAWGESDPAGLKQEERLQKYLESNLQVSKPFPWGRTYLLGRYRQSIEGSSRGIPQTLPELGLIVNTGSVGAVSFDMAVTGTNFWRKNEQRGQRLDVYPNFYLSLGRTVNFTQKVGLRETLYVLDGPARTTSREIFDLRSILTTRFLKKYPSLIHTIEPTVEYIYIPHVDRSNIPMFDSTDSMPRTSGIVYSLTNRLSGSFWGKSEARLRLSQSYSLRDIEKPYSPVLIESNLVNRNLNFSVNAFYDVYVKNITDTIASVRLTGQQGFIGIGKNFRRSTNLDQYSVEAGVKRLFEIFNSPLPVSLYTKLWYDVEDHTVQELNVTSTYTKQCWGLTVSFTQKPDEYQVMFGVEFKGFGSLKIG